MNGFVYSTTRKPKINKKDEIVETLDRNEVLDGKKFRIVDAPWLMGRKPGEPGSDPEPTVVPPTQPDAPAPLAVAPVAEAPAVAVTMAPMQTTQVPVETPAAKTSRTVTIGINQLNDQTVEQVFTYVLDSIDNDEGEVLHLTDIVGETLIDPNRNPPFLVIKDKLIEHLRRTNLLCLPD